MTNKERGTLAVLAGVGLFLFFKRPAKAAEPPAELAPPPTPEDPVPVAPTYPGDLVPADLSRDDYIEDLYERSRFVWDGAIPMMGGFEPEHSTGDSVLDEVTEAWTPARLAMLVIAAAEERKIPPEPLWAALGGWNEGAPAGIYLDDPNIAQAMGATEYGITRYSLYRWGVELANGTTPEGLAHIDLIYPPLAIIATADSFRRGWEKRGGAPGMQALVGGIATEAQAQPEWLAKWWTTPAHESDASRLMRARIDNAVAQGEPWKTAETLPADDPLRAFLLEHNGPQFFVTRGVQNRPPYTGEHWQRLARATARISA